MGKNVYANGRGISCKSGSAKVMAAFPDVCLSPPTPPAGPIPIPYPLFSGSPDTAEGSKTLVIGGKEAMLKDKSNYKKCSGDEAATKSLGQGVITHTLGGKVYFVSWSMDVEIEGENVVRHLDMTSSNHASPMANASVPMANVEDFGFDTLTSCAGQPEKCRMKTQSQCASDSKGARTGHHVIQDHCSKAPGKKGGRYQGCGKVTRADAPTICVTGIDRADANPSGGLKQHGRIHDIIDPVENAQPNNKWDYATARDEGCAAAAKVTGCSAQCLADQCDTYYQDQCGVKPTTKMRADTSGKKKVRGLKLSKTASGVS